jgi:hypothetical protein
MWFALPAACWSEGFWTLYFGRESTGFQWQESLANRTTWTCPTSSPLGGPVLASLLSASENFGDIMMRSRPILIGMVLVAVCLATLCAIRGREEPPRGAKVQANELKPGNPTDNADNEVLSGEVTIAATHWLGWTAFRWLRRGRASTWLR